MISKKCSQKEQAIYDAVFELFWDGMDLNNLTVSQITQKAGIGKGTAYEYFSDKEEMIAKALFYSTGNFCRRIYEGTREKSSFQDKIMHILLSLEEEVGESNCIFRLVHGITDNSSVGKKLKELMENKEEDIIMVEDVMRLTILDEYGQILISQEKMFYLVTSSISRILCYGMILNSPCHKGEYRKETVREMVCTSICRETEELLKA